MLALMFVGLKLKQRIGVKVFNKIPTEWSVWITLTTASRLWNLYGKSSVSLVSRISANTRKGVLGWSIVRLIALKRFEACIINLQSVVFTGISTVILNYQCIIEMDSKRIWSILGHWWTTKTLKAITHSTPSFSLILSLSLCTYYFGWLSWLIPFVWTWLSRVECETSNKNKTKWKILVNSGIRTHNLKIHGQTRPKLR